MTDKTATPRTDAECYEAMSIDGEGSPRYNDHSAVDADFARTLERELTQLRDQLAQVTKERDHYRACVVPTFTDESDPASFLLGHSFPLKRGQHD